MPKVVHAGQVVWRSVRDAKCSHSSQYADSSSQTDFCLSLSSPPHDNPLQPWPQTYSVGSGSKIPTWRMREKTDGSSARTGGTLVSLTASV